MLPTSVLRTIDKYKMLLRGDRVLVGVCGGADSVCLLLVLKEIGFDVAAVHINHGLRGVESDSDEAFVEDFCRRLKLPFYSRRVNILTEKGNLEATGRQLRRSILSDLAREAGFAKIALAHNRNDRVETFLLNLLRGAGPTGLTSMEPVSGRVVR